MTLSTATCVVYDHLTTLDLEVELVWKRPKWSLVQVLFLINRYVGDALQIFSAFVLVRHIVMDTIASCNFINVLMGFLATIVMCAMQGIMSYRVSSMYNHNHTIVVVLVAALVLEVSLVILVQILTIGVHSPVPQPAPGVRLCAQDSFPSWMYTLWIPIIAFELLVLVLSLSLAVKYYQSVRLMRRINAKPPDSLPYILLRDSITFPFICLVICILNLISWIRLPYLVTQFTFAFAAFAPIILGSRLILNLREAYYQPFIEELDSRKTGGEEVSLQLHGRITGTTPRSSAAPRTRPSV